jgi:hypothetical protein
MGICTEQYIVTYSYGVFSTVFSRLVGRPIAVSQLTGVNEVQLGLKFRDVLYRRFFELMCRKEYFELWYSCLQASVALTVLT